MNQEYEFLDLDGLEDIQEKEELLMHLNSVHINPNVEFPWDFYEKKDRDVTKGDGNYLNVFAPSFKSAFPLPGEATEKRQPTDVPFMNNCNNNVYYTQYTSVGVPSTSDYCLPNVEHGTNCHSMSPLIQEMNGNYPYLDCNYAPSLHPSKIIDSHSNLYSSQVPVKVEKLPEQTVVCVSEENLSSDRTFNANFVDVQDSGFDVSAGVPGCIAQTVLDSNGNGFGDIGQDHEEALNQSSKEKADSCSEKVFPESDAIVSHEEHIVENSVWATSQSPTKDIVASKSCVNASTIPAVPRSFADVLKSKGDKRTATSLFVRSSVQQNAHTGTKSNVNEDKKASIDDDKLAIELGRHLFQWRMDLRTISLQPRGLINRSNWCYINATLQALLACSPFYSLLRDLPVGVCVERGLSSTPVIDSMVKLSYEFLQLKEDQEELQLGVPFQPGSVYEMLGTLKSHCIKGLQEDAEEFLSFILNGMHEEMALVIKNYEKQYNLCVNSVEEMNGNGEVSDGEEEWQVIGAKKRGMVTRKVVEHKTPISDLLGGQIKSFLTINGNKTSASVQPFFTLPLDIQSENITSVEEALDQMTVKEPIQGYQCAKTKQEVEAYCRIMLQKLPPVLILHLKRFIYNRNGGCKKIMKHTEYPITLEFKKELFSPEAKKGKKQFSYKLFAVMYHDGVEALIGHYICDIYHHASKSWIRCDDRNITPITEAQVLSHSPPKVPYLLFYQVCDLSQEKMN